MEKLLRKIITILGFEGKSFDTTETSYNKYQDIITEIEEKINQLEGKQNNNSL